MPYLILILLVFLASCSNVPDEMSEQLKIDDDKVIPLSLEPVLYSALPGWGGEDFKDFALAFNRSCQPIIKTTRTEFRQGQEWGDVAALAEKCSTFQTLKTDQYKNFFEQNFQPYALTANGEAQGLFTGYYEASLNGSRRKHGPYQYKLRALPNDLIMIDLGEFREELKGQRIAGRVQGNQLKPYESRADIEAGKMPDAQDIPLVWVDDSVDAFFVQIQGSGVVQLDDGSVMRIGYAGQNGHPYYAIGRELIKREELTNDTVSLQTIRAWLKDNPDEAEDVMNTNASYVFFREIEGDGPIGGQGVALTALRSLAIDYTKIPYGVPLWVDLAYPKPGYKNIQRLMVAQDTGGAIRGPVRGDFFWGYGEFAEGMAGIMKSQGRYWVLLPK